MPGLATETLAPESTSIPSTPSPPVINAPVLDSPSLLSIRMLDSNNGWGINETKVLRTTNSGLTWHDVGPSGLIRVGYSVSTDFLDERHAWILVPNPNNLESGILYRTNDGGINWNESPAPFASGSMDFLDARRGWMMSDLGAGAGSMGVAVYQTQDGGVEWMRTYTNDPNNSIAGDSLPLGGLKNRIAPVSMQQAWIGGVTYSPGSVYLYQTNDGGSSWVKSPVTAPNGFEKAELETTGPVFINSKVAFLPVHLSFQKGVMLAVYISRDGGGSWSVSPTFVPQGGPSDFVSESAGFVWNGSDFYTTNDAAQTWTVIVPDIDFSDSFAGMDFVSPDVGFVLSDDGTGISLLYKTLDGGRTWNVVGM